MSRQPNFNCFRPEGPCPADHPTSVAQGLYCCQGLYEKFTLSEVYPCLGRIATWDTPLRCGQMCIPCPRTICNTALKDEGE